jgi:hypothetical protein
MRKLFSIPIPLVLVGLLGGCGVTDASPPPLGVSVTTSSSELRAGEILGVTVTVVNRGSTPVTTVIDPCGYQFEVTTLSGERIGPRGCFLMSLGWRTLAPGETRTIQTNWLGESARPADDGYARAGNTRSGENCLS